jgi:hypothetical protein
MGHWGIKSYENDGAADALDAGFDRVHGERYDELMDDRNPLTYEQVQQRLADPRTLAASIEALWEAVGREVAPEDWDDEARLAMAGVVVRHAELKVPIPEEWRRRAIDWLDGEEIEWESVTTRKLRRQKEVDLLRRATSTEAGPDRDNPPA